MTTDLAPTRLWVSKRFDVGLGILTLICLKPAFSRRNLAECTAWKAGTMVRSSCIRAVKLHTAWRNIEEVHKVLCPFQGRLSRHAAISGFGKV
jgi:hypothetical protein